MYKRISNMINMFSSTTVKDTKMGAVIYARCSTPSQNQDKGTSLATQIAECRHYCNANNFEITEVISEVISGHNSSKQSYNTILEKYKNTNVVISDPSRLSRNIGNASNFIDGCIKKNITLHCVRDNLVCSTINEFKAFTNLIFDAMIESQTISKRIRSSINTRRQMGSHIGVAPYGYKIEHVQDLNSGMKIRKLVRHSLEMNTVRLIQKMYYGCTSAEFYNALYNVESECEYKLEDNSGNAFDNLYYGNVLPSNIATVLNDNSIYCRGKLWTSSHIRNIVTRNPATKKIFCK